ncbi:MAG TPA: hypothetical protein VM487_15120 [Phycisphaerae bacterium]|nr:hypothetical protein [Phycisphaerae bacterium]
MRTTGVEISHQGDISLIGSAAGLVVPTFAFALWAWMSWYSQQTLPGSGTSIWVPDFASVCLPLTVWPMAAISALLLNRRRDVETPDSRRPRWPWLILMSLAAGFYLLVPLWSMRVWNFWWRDIWSFEAGLVVSLWAMLYAAVCLLVRARLPNSLRWLRTGTIAASVALAVTFSTLHIMKPYWVFTKPYWASYRPVTNALINWVASASVVVACCAIGVGLLHRFSLRRAFRSLHRDFPGFRLDSACPRCGAAQAFPIGRSECRSCGLVLFFDIEEELCVKCGYRLFGLPSDRCPECGTLRAPSRIAATTASESEAMNGP